MAVKFSSGKKIRQVRKTFRRNENSELRKNSIPLEKLSFVDVFRKYPHAVIFCLLTVLFILVEFL